MKKKMTNKDKTFWAVIIPVLILFFAFNTLPMIKGFIYSFTNYKGYGTYEYVGFRNYIDLFTDARVGKSYLFTFKYAIVGTILVNFLSLVLALGLNSKIRNLLCSEYFRRTGNWLYFQLYFYLHPSGNWNQSSYWMASKQYFGK